MLCIYHLLLIFVKLLLKLVDWNRSGKIIALSHFTVQTFQFIYHFPCLNTLCNGFQSQRLGKPNRKLRILSLCLSCRIAFQKTHIQLQHIDRDFRQHIQGRIP